jgi:hypothetical protein
MWKTVFCCSGFFLLSLGMEGESLGRWNFGEYSQSEVFWSSKKEAIYNIGDTREFISVDR